MSKAIDWFITPKCNDKCKFCYAPRTFKDYGLSQQDYFEICNQIIKLGFEYVTICGGEPTLNSNIVDIVKYLYQKGIRVIFYSNGIEKEVVKSVLPFIYYLSLPIDGVDEKTNLLRSREQNQHVIKLLDELEENCTHIKIKIGTVVSKVNINCLEYIYHIIEKYKMINCWRLYQFSAGEKGDENRSLYEVTEEEYWNAVNILKRNVVDKSLLSFRTREENKGYCIIMNQKGDLFRYEEKYVDLKRNIYNIEVDEMRYLYDITNNSKQKDWLRK